MPFELIENPRPVALNALPVDGVLVRSMSLGRRNGEGKTRYISVSVGRRLAHELVWRDEAIKIDLAFGTGRDAGKIRASVNLSSGQFRAKRNKRGEYVFTLNEAACDGLFALEFPPFCVMGLTPVSEVGKPPALVFDASAEMLAVED